ncbi:MAG: Ig domain-containing protein [Halioglobus sp.]
MDKVKQNVKRVSIASALALIGACGGGGGGAGGPVNAAQSPPGQPAGERPDLPGPQAENMPPTISGEPLPRVVSGASYDFLPSASDPNGDALTFEAENLPSWLTLDSSTGNIYGTPGFGELGVFRSITIKVNDGSLQAVLPPFDILVDAPVFTSDNFIPSGRVVDTETGYTVDGALAFEFAGRRQRIENANLAVTLGANGDLLDLAGEGMLPKAFDDMVRLDAGVTTTVGMLSGFDINSDTRFDVNVLDSRQYMLFFLDYGITLEIDNPAFPGQPVTVSSPDIPGIPSFLMISDPYDPMYYYGDGEEFGWAFSQQGLLPFVPTLDHPLITPFEGHHYFKGTIPVGFKVFDFFSFTGESIVHDPLMAPMVQTTFFTDGQAQWNAKANAGFNGAFKFDFTVGPVGLFRFDIGDATAAFEFSPEDQYFVMQGLIDPDVSWVPGWMPFVPDASLSALLVHEIVAGVPSVEATIKGAYKSTLPEADVEGSIYLTMDSATLEGVVRDDIDIPVSITFKDNETVARVELDIDFSDQVSARISSTFNSLQGEVDEATADLQEAIGSYDLAVSLNGLRTQLPGIADTAISRLNAIPESVRGTVYNEVVAGINDKRVCTIGCTPSNAARNALANTAANSARDAAIDAIAPDIRAFNDLKTRALQADDASLRDGLEQALRTAYANRRFNRTFSESVSFTIFGKRYTASGSKTVNVTLIDSPLDAQVLTAANNVQNIGASETVVISTQAIVDALPTQEILDSARAEAEEKTSRLPGVESIGYTVVGGVYSAFVELNNGEVYEVGFNVLSFEDAVEGIAELLSEAIVGG